MELSVLSHTGVPRGSLLSLRSGAVRRQAPLSSGRQFKFPSLENPIKVDLFMPIASGYLVTRPGETRYDIDFGPDVDMQCRLGLAPLTQEKIQAPIKPVSSNKNHDRLKLDAAACAKEYVEQHGILEFLQGALRAVIREKPKDPLAAIAHLFQTSSLGIEGDCKQPMENPLSVSVVGTESRAKLRNSGKRLRKSWTEGMDNVDVDAKETAARRIQRIQRGRVVQRATAEDARGKAVQSRTAVFTDVQESQDARGKAAQSRTAIFTDVQESQDARSKAVQSRTAIFNDVLESQDARGNAVQSRTAIFNDVLESQDARGKAVQSRTAIFNDVLESQEARSKAVQSRTAIFNDMLESQEARSKAVQSRTAIFNDVLESQELEAAKEKARDAFIRCITQVDELKEDMLEDDLARKEAAAKIQSMQRGRTGQRSTAEQRRNRFVSDGQDDAQKQTSNAGRLRTQDASDGVNARNCYTPRQQRPKAFPDNSEVLETSENLEDVAQKASGAVIAGASDGRLQHFLSQALSP